MYIDEVADVCLQDFISLYFVHFINTCNNYRRCLLCQWLSIFLQAPIFYILHVCSLLLSSHTSKIYESKFIFLFLITPPSFYCAPSLIAITANSKRCNVRRLECLGLLVWQQCRHSVVRNVQSFPEALLVCVCVCAQMHACEYICNLEYLVFGLSVTVTH